MATRKTESAEEMQETAGTQETGEVRTDPWKETVRMIVPRKPKGDDPQYYICVNDVRYTVPANGREQDLPRPVAEILKDSLVMEDIAEEYAEHVPNRGSEPPVPHAIG